MAECGDDSSLGNLEKEGEVDCREARVNFVEDLLDHSNKGSLCTGQGLEAGGEVGEV